MLSFDDAPMYPSNVQNALLKYSDVRIPGYDFPKKETLNHVSRLIHALGDEDEPEVRRHLAALKMKTFRFNEANEGVVLPGDKFFLFVPQDRNGPMATGIFWRPGETRNITIQDPHTDGDGAFRVSTQMWCESRAQSWIFAYCARESSKEKRHGRSIADGCHVAPHTFATACQAAWFVIGDDVCAVQVHGMEGSENSYLLVNNGAGHQYARYSFGEFFARRMLDEFGPDVRPKLKMVSRKLPFKHDFGDTKGSIQKNIQAAALAIRGTDSGRFLHLETSPFFRDDKKHHKDHREKLINAISLAADDRRAWFADRRERVLGDESRAAEHDHEDSEELMRGAGATPKFTDPEE